MWCSAADTHLKLLDRADSGARFLTGDVFECDIGHRRSVAVLCSSVTVLCNSAGYTMCPGRTSVYLCTTSLQNLAYRRTFVPLSVSLWNDLVDPVFDGVGLAGFKSRANIFLLA